MKLFSGSANKPLAEKVAKEMGIPLSPIEEHIFPDGEERIRIVDTVVDEHVVVIQTASTPVDVHYMELFFIVDGLKRSGAEQVSAVVPYFGYQRQDHVFRDGEAVSLEVVIKILESVGVDRLISFDMHSPKIPDLFHIPVTHVSALPLFAEKIKKEKWHDMQTILISPDMGGIARIKKISESLGGMSFAAVEKNRDLASGKVSAEFIRDGSLSGKTRAIIVDDMIASGATMITAANVLFKHGITDIYAFATHPVFAKHASTLLQQSQIKKFFVTDTVLLPKEKRFEKLEVLSVAKLITTALQ